MKHNDAWTWTRSHQICTVFATYGLLLMLSFSSLYSDFCTLNTGPAAHFKAKTKSCEQFKSKNRLMYSLTGSYLHLFLSGEEGPWLHFCVGFRQWWAQQGPLLLWWLHQLHLYHLHLQHSRERTQAMVPGGMFVHANNHLQQWGELRPQDCKDWHVCVL